MPAGIKYCGGCRASFDRKAEAARVISEAEGSAAGGESPVFEYAEEGGYYDVLLVVCGCRSRCPDISAYRYGRVVYIDEAGMKVIL